MLKGSVEITLQDKEGNIKQQVVKNNAQTDVFKTQLFYTGLNTSIGASKRLAPDIVSNVISVQGMGSAAGTSGIFLLPEQVTERNVYPAPYVNSAGVFDSSKVVFYNDTQSLIETDKIMSIKTNNCYFDHITNTNYCEYFKVNGSGTIKSIIFGKSSNSEVYINNIIRDHDLNINAETFTGVEFVLEHDEDSTTVWKTRDSHEQMSYNYKTKEYKKYDNIPLDTNIKAFTQGFKIGNRMFKVSKTNFLTIVLTYVENCFNTTTVKTITITFPNTGPSVGVSTLAPYPIMIYRHDNNTLEILHTTSKHLDYYKSYYIIQKSVIDLDTMEHTEVKLSEFPYCITSNPDTLIAITSTGFHHGVYKDSKYYVPHMFTGILGVETETVYYGYHVVSNPAGTTMRFDGLVTEDFETIEKMYNHVILNAGNSVGISTTQLVISHEGVMQCRVGQPKMPYIYYSSLTNYLNLDTPIVKGEDDILKIRYIDKLEALDEVIE